MAKYKVKKIRKEGPDKGKWGVYRSGQLMISYTTKSAATYDMNRRSDNPDKD